MPLASVHYPDLGKGVNRGISPEQLPSAHCSELINLYPYGTTLRRRGANRLVTTGAAWSLGTITGLASYYTAAAGWQIVGGGDTGFFRLSGADFVNISDSTSGNASPPPAIEYSPWCFLQYKNYMYGLRKRLSDPGIGNPGSGRFFRFDQTQYDRAGLIAPTGVATLAAGAAGLLPAGNYSGVVTFYESATGTESNPSPVSNTLALGANLKIDWTGIPLFTSFNGLGHKPTMSRRLYRTVVDQPNVYYLVTTIADNTTTTYTDNSVVTALGTVASFNNGTPPYNLSIGDIWQERLWASDGRDLFFSQFFKPEDFGAADIITITPDDGHKIVGIKAFDDRLIVGKTNSMWYLTGTGITNFDLHVLSLNHGLASHHSMKSAEGQLYWLGKDRVVYKWDGSTVSSISNPQVTEYLENIPSGKEEQVVAGLYPQKSWYILNLPIGNDQNRRSLVYDYRLGTWSVFEFGGAGLGPGYVSIPNNTAGFTLLTDVFDSNGSHIIYGAVISQFGANNVYQFADESVLTDSIPMSVAFKAEDFGLPGTMKAPRRIGVLYDYNRLANPNVGHPDKLSIYGIKDGTLNTTVLGLETSADFARKDIILDDGGNYWRYYAFPTDSSGSHLRATRIRTKLVFESIDPNFTIREFRLDANVSSRTGKGKVL